MRPHARRIVLPVATSSLFKIPANYFLAGGVPKPMGMDLSAKVAEYVDCCCMRRSRLMPETMRYWGSLMRRSGIATGAR